MKYIKTSIHGFLNESNSYNIKFETNGDYEIEVKILTNKLNIINKYFPFNNVTGYYIDDTGTELNFDNDIIIKGTFDEEHFNVHMMIGDIQYDINIHPFDGMGGFSDNIFEENIKIIYNEENTISLVLSHEGYAVKSYSINKLELSELKIFLVNGTQIEGKTLGKTINAKQNYREK
jgi:hypothetical protein